MSVESQQLPFSLSKDFKVERVLGYDAKQKLIFLLGSVVVNNNNNSSPTRTIVILEKTQFPIDSLDVIHDWMTLIEEPSGMGLQQVIGNDKYYMMNVPVKASDNFNLIKSTIIYPADESDIQKYSMETLVLFQETPSIYTTITKPYIESIPSETIKWVDNLLTKEGEAEHLIFEDTESDEDLRFMLHPDMKFDKVDCNQLYCIAFCFNPEIKSIRDLSTERHLLMLKNIRDRGCQAIGREFGVTREKLRIFVHYWPSFFRFHVHFTNVDNTSVNNGVERCHLLDDIIENMELFGLDYYQKRTLTVSMKKSHKLYSKFNSISSGSSISSNNTDKE